MKNLMFVLCLLPLGCMANDSPSAGQWQDESYKDFVKSKYLAYKQAYQTRSNECFKQGISAKFSNASISKLNMLNLTKDELTDTLVYLSYKAHLSCVDTLPIMTVGLLNEARNLNIDGFSKSNDPDFKMLNNLIVDTQAIIRGEYKFSQLSVDKQAVFNSIDEFKKPFSIEVISKIKTK